MRYRFVLRLIREITSPAFDFDALAGANHAELVILAVWGRHLIPELVRCGGLLQRSNDRLLGLAIGVRRCAGEIGQQVKRVLSTAAIGRRERTPFIFLNAVDAGASSVQRVAEAAQKRFIVNALATQTSAIAAAFAG